MIEDYYKPGYVIEAVTLTDDGGGSKTKIWAEDSSLGNLGRLVALSGDERISNAKLGIISTHKLFRPNANITEAHRMKDTNDGNRIYNIVFINPVKDGDNEVHHLNIDLMRVE